MSERKIKRFDASMVLWILCAVVFVVAVIIAW